MQANSEASSLKSFNCSGYNFFYVFKMCAMNVLNFVWKEPIKLITESVDALFSVVFRLLKRLIAKTNHFKVQSYSRLFVASCSNVSQVFLASSLLGSLMICLTSLWFGDLATQLHSWLFVQPKKMKQITEIKIESDKMKTFFMNLFSPALKNNKNCMDQNFKIEQQAHVLDIQNIKF